MWSRSRVVAVAFGLSLIVVVGVVGIPVLYPSFVYLTTHPPRLNLRVAYYSGEGTTPACHTIIVHAVEWMGCSATPIRGWDIREGCLAEYDVVLFPGGHPPAFRDEVGPVGRILIQDFVANGGGYFGICGCAYIACDYTIIEDDPAFPIPNTRIEGENLSLDLFPGVAWGPVFEVPHETTLEGMTQIDIHHNHPITASLPDTYQIQYLGGPHFQPYIDADCTILGTFHINDAPAIVACPYHAGRVFLISVHGEIEERSDRDGWELPPQYGIEPYDEDTEYPLLYEAMRWIGHLTPNPAPPTRTYTTLHNRILTFFTKEEPKLPIVKFNKN